MKILKRNGRLKPHEASHDGEQTANHAEYSNEYDLHYDKLMNSPSLIDNHAGIFDYPIEYIAAYCRKHKNEIGYDYSFDCNYAYAGVLPSFNTIEALKRNPDDWKYQGYRKTPCTPFSGPEMFLSQMCRIALRLTDEKALQGIEFIRRF